MLSLTQNKDRNLFFIVNNIFKINKKRRLLAQSPFEKNLQKTILKNLVNQNRTFL